MKNDASEASDFYQGVKRLVCFCKNSLIHFSKAVVFQVVFLNAGYLGHTILPWLAMRDDIRVYSVT